MARSRPPSSPGAEALRQQIERWRHTRRKRSPMPSRLWTAAVALAHSEGLGPTARTLSLSYESLKCHAAMAPRELAASPAPRPAFVQLGPATALSAAQSNGPVVELSAQDGQRLTIRLPVAASLDVVGLATLWLSLRA